MSFWENIAVFTSLVTTIGDMELKRKVVHDAKWFYYLEPQDEVTLLPQEAILLPHEDATLFPQEEATLLPQEAAHDEPFIPFITPWAVDGDV